ncbi:unnamed protein product [Phytomonas sp. EM1]|nr:unnamed protein product [Phytomonas sp. EM1]|eukprot:CCW64559.1 unnamed protein product [Phytomonas sp. isolate EM1]
MTLGANTRQLIITNLRTGNHISFTCRDLGTQSQLHDPPHSYDEHTDVVMFPEGFEGLTCFKTVRHVLHRLLNEEVALDSVILLVTASEQEFETAMPPEGTMKVLELGKFENGIWAVMRRSSPMGMSLECCLNWILNNLRRGGGERRSENYGTHLDGF